MTQLTVTCWVLLSQEAFVQTHWLHESAVRKASIRPVWECHLHHLFCLSSSWREDFPRVSNVLLSCPLLIILRFLQQLLLRLAEAYVLMILCLWFSDMDNHIYCSIQSCCSSVLKTSISFLGSLEVSRRCVFEPSAGYNSDQLVPQLHQHGLTQGALHSGWMLAASCLEPKICNTFFAAELAAAESRTHAFYSPWLYLINSIKHSQTSFQFIGWKVGGEECLLAWKYYPERD